MDPPIPGPERRAIQSLLDVVEEIALGLAHGQMPEQDWAEVVTETFAKHRRELHGEIVAWPQDHGQDH